ncbi:MAG: SusC/RagA family TonB-linked outer membrane protein [Sphingobacteriaceae bacterium]|nr:MAG: SusC/RagA family TonB-linked outer membrane protein [Sphingobacteriaceae bacterium]
MQYCYFKKSFSVIMLLAFMLVTAGYAQDTSGSSAGGNELTGIVLDNYGRALKNVSVVYKGATDTIKTDSLGAFGYSAPKAGTLVFTYPDYNIREVSVKGNAQQLKVKMYESYIKTPEMVDMLYRTIDRKSVLGSVATVYTSQLTTTPASLYTYALPGQLAGLYTQQTSGFALPQTVAASSSGLFGSTPSAASRTFAPVDNTEFALASRGQSPITVIDGVQREIASIDPESIESVSILKDALSVMGLGINSSRGVLLITTKKPTGGDPRITFTALSGIQKSLGLPDDQLSSEQYAYLYNEALTNSGLSPLYTSTDFAAYRDNTNQYSHPDVDWFSTLLRKSSPMQAYRLNVGGGTGFAKYTVSANYYQQDGMFKESSTEPYSTNAQTKRYIVNSNISVKVTKNLYVDLQLFGRIQQGRTPGSEFNGLIGAIYSTPSNAYPIFQENGSLGGSNAQSATGPFSNNLLSRAQRSGYTQTNMQDVLANLDLNYNLNDFVQGLTIKGKGNVSFQSASALFRTKQNSSFFLRPDGTLQTVGVTTPQSNVFSQVATARYTFGQVALNYDRQFGKHNISSSLFTDFRQVTISYALSSTTTNRALRVAYNYDGKYYAEGFVNNSGYNRYAPGSQNGWFYAGGLGWQMGEESFIKDNIDWISSWKWRATYGRTGNRNVDEVGYYIFRQTYSTNAGGWASTVGYYVGDGRSYTQGYNSDPLANPYITWEKADKIDVGVDIGLFKDKLMITADYYNNRYFDLVGVRGRSTAVLGIPYTSENVGINRFYGGELTLTYKGNINNFNYFISANGNLQQSKVVYMDEISTDNPYNMRTGKPVGTQFGYEWTGFYRDADDVANSAHIAGIATPQPGDLKYKDQNNDGVVNQYDQVPISSTKPMVFYGSSLGFNYKGISFSMILQGVQNRMVQLYNSYTRPFLGVNAAFGTPSAPYGQAYQNAFGRWTPETAETATLPRLTLENNPNNDNTLTGTNSSFYFKKANYFRLKNAEIGYELPLSFVRKIKVSGIRVFVNGENLFTATDFQYGDPEVFSTNAYPIQRVFSAGLTLKL